MDLKTVLEVLEGKVFPPPLGLSQTADRDLENLEFSCGGAADLMSDVLAFAKSGSLLLTGLTNPQVVRTADILEIAAIILVRGKRPPQETIQLAQDLKIPILTTKYILFETSGRLHEKGIVGCIEKVGSNRADAGRE